jgi:hypothetical protein
MKKNIVIALAALILTVCFSTVFAQSVQDFKVKNAQNSKERTEMLDLLRNKLMGEYKQEFVFVVNHFKVNAQYAWFMGDAQRKDGKKVQVGQHDDCCGVQALFKKSGGKWTLAEYGAFPTDVWYAGLEEKYPGIEVLMK